MLDTTLHFIIQTQSDIVSVEQSETTLVLGLFVVEAQFIRFTREFAKAMLVASCSTNEACLMKMAAFPDMFASISLHVSMFNSSAKHPSSLQKELSFAPD